MENKKVKLNEYQKRLINELSKKEGTISVTYGFGKDQSKCG